MQRRSFLQGAACAATSALMPSLSAQASNEKPNMLVILVDDMGYSDLGCYGGEIHTPVLDRLAHGGVRFTQFYNAARCCPTRASLLTGQYPHQAGIGGMDRNEGVPSYQGVLNRESVTLAEALKPAGYSCYHTGKWHVGLERGHWPLDRGFDRYFGLINGSTNFFSDVDQRDPSKKKTYLLDDETYPVPATTEEQWLRNEGFYVTDAFTDYALRFLDEHPRENPFLLYLSHTAPHWPLHAFPEDMERYRGRYDRGWDVLRRVRYERQREMGLFDDSVQLAAMDYSNFPAWDDAPQAMRDEFIVEMELYAAMIDRMDRNIGRVVDHLEETGQLDNTMILFVSDNGGCHTTPSYEHLQGTPGGPNSWPCYGYMGAEVSNTPFRKWKQHIHEGGIATPGILHFPNAVQNAGRFDNSVAHVIDIMPTVMDYAGASYPETYAGHDIQPMRGISLRPALEEQPLQRSEPLYWEHVQNKGIRIGDWKLVAAKPDLEWELYNIAQDRSELTNLVGEHPDRAEDMERQYTAWARANRVKPYHKG